MLARFGHVAVSGDTVVVGAFCEDSAATGVNGDQTDNSARNAGAAYVFVRSGTNWSQQAYLKASCPGAGDLFGSYVAVSGDTVVVGAHGEDSAACGVNGNEANDSAADAGAAYVFLRSGTNWSQQAYLKASNTETGDGFGHVAVSGDTVVVGAGGEDSAATGLNGDQDDNSAADAGAAYVFVRSGTTWSQSAYLKASNAGAGDCFGCSVAVSGDTGVVGACYEDSGAIQVNGDQADNSRRDAGAAYVFTGLGTPVTLGIAQNGVGGCSFCCRGVPDLTYRLLRAASLAGPWDTLSASTAPASGHMEFQDNSPLPGAGFYRIAVGTGNGINP